MPVPRCDHMIWSASMSLLTAANWKAIALFGLLVTGIGVTALALVGVTIRSPKTEITHEPPFTAFIGREYLVRSALSAYAWNDFPDKAKLLSVSLLPPPGVRNRFVSFVIPLEMGQRLRIISAWRDVGWGTTSHYVVAVPDAGLPDGIPVTIAVNGDGILDPRIYEPVDK